MNKIIYLKQKGIVVIKFTLLILILIFSSFVIFDNNNDYSIINSQLIKFKSKYPSKTIFLNESNSNEFIISIVMELDSLEKINNKLKVDSLKQEIGIESNEKFNSIFNKNEYSYFLTQKNIHSKWNFNKILNAKNYNSFKQKQEDFLNLYISKPIYTKNNNYALVNVRNPKTCYIIIFERSGKEWKEYKIISPMITSAKKNVIEN